MIAKLTGLVDSLGEDWVVIDVGGVGYLVFGSGGTLGRLAVGEIASLEIETHVREDHIHLYGFADAVERDWFRILMTVQGVGARVALAILTVLAPDQLMPAIAAGDRAALTRAAGVGGKLAGRIVAELKDKVGDIALGPGGGGGRRGRGHRRRRRRLGLGQPGLRGHGIVFGGVSRGAPVGCAGRCRCVDPGRLIGAGAQGA